MINSRRITPLLAVILFLASCTGAPVTSPPTPDQGALNTAVETAVAATRTAEAAITPAPALLSTTSPASSPTGQNVAETLPTNTPVLVLAETPTPLPAANTSAASPVCTVVTQSLNIRIGPGVAYEPPLVKVTAGTTLTPLAFSPVGFPGGQWVQVQAGSQIGWVSADPQFITCNIDPAGLPLAAAIPPTPTSVPTPTPIPSQPTATPSPTPEAFAFFEPPGGGNDNIGGGVVFPGYTQGQLDYNDLVFRDQLVFQVVAFDKNKGQTDGTGIDNVRFEIFGDQGTVYERTEQNPGYCLFGGGEPHCTLWRFAEHNYRWPEPHQDQVIANGDYSVQITINPESGDAANWNFNFRIEGAADQPANLTAQIVQIGPGTTSGEVNEALVFQVFASTDNHNDGAGIDRVDLRIIKDGQEVYQRMERNAAYCAFSGGEPDCNIWVFAEHGYTWPGGQPIEPGLHLLRATAYAKNGQTATVEMTIEIQPNL